MLLRDRLLLLLPNADGADQIVSLILESFRNVAPISDTEDSFAFEFKALEAVFETIISLLDHEYRLIEPDVLQSLGKLESEASGLSLQSYVDCCSATTSRCARIGRASIAQERCQCL